jgi:hypothetical protein
VFRPNLHSRPAAVFVRNVTESLDRPIGPIYIPGGLLSFVCYVTERLDRLLDPISTFPAGCGVCSQCDRESG